MTALALMLASRAYGDGTWLGGSATDGSWSDLTNWVGGTIPGATSGTTNTEIATFNSAPAQTTVIIDAGRNIKSLVFDTATAAAFTIGSTPGNSLLLTSGGSITINSTVVNSQTVNAPLVLEPASGTTAGTYTFSNNSSSNTVALLINGNVTGDTTTAGITLTLSASNASATTFSTISGVISDGGAAGGLSITKTGSGIWTLSGANTYTGATNVNGGKLIIANAAALGDSANGVTVASGASLSLSGSITTAAAETITINGLGVGSQGALNNTSGTNVWAGIVNIGTPSGAGTNNAARIGASGGTLTVSGVIQDSGGNNSLAVRNGDTTGATVFSGANTYDGTTHIVVGPLTVSSINSVTTDAGLGTVHSSSSNLGAPTTVANGTIYFSSGTAAVAQLIYTGAGETTDRNLVLFGTTTGATLTANTTGGGLLKFLGTVSAPGTAATDNRKTLTLQGTGAAEIDGVISDSVLGTAGQLATSVTKTSSGSWTLSGANTFSGKVTITGGMLIVSSLNSVATNAGLGTVHSASSNLGVPTDVASGTITLGSGTTTGSQLIYTGTGETTDRVINLGGTTGGATIVQNGSGVLHFTSGVTATGAGSKTFQVLGAGSGEIDGGIVDNSSTNKTNFTENGTGTWVFSGAGLFTYTGTTTITSGTLQAAQANVFASGSAFTMGTVAASVLDFNGFNQTLGSLAGGGASGGNVLMGAGTMTVGGNNTSTTYSGVISGGGGVIKIGTGALTLSGTNTFGGGVIVKAGTIVASNASALGTAATTLGDSTSTNSASLLFNTTGGTNPLTVANVGSGVLTIGNSGTTTAGFAGAITLQHALTVATISTASFTQSGAVSGTGDLTVVNGNTSGTANASVTGAISTTGNIILSNNGAGTGSVIIGSATNGVNNTGTITNNGTSTTGNASISGALGANVTSVIQNSATSKLTLGVANTAYLGTVVINAGTVAFGATNALNANNVVSIAAAGTLDVNNTTSTIAGVNDISGAGGTVTNSSAAANKVLTLGGSGNYAFSGTLTATTPANLALTVALTGSGTQTLTGNSTYTGATLVNSGTLTLTTGSLGGTNVTIGTGTTGNGILNVVGNYTIGNATAGSLTLKGGGPTTGLGTLNLQDSAINTLTLPNTTGGLTLGGSAGSASVINFDIGNVGISDQIAIGGALTVNAGGATLNLNLLNGSTLTSGTYTLMTFGSQSGVSALAIGTTPAVPAGQVGSFTLNTTATQEQLVVSLATLGATAYWAGTESTNWNTITSGTSATNFRLNADGSGGFVLPGSTTDVFFTTNVGVGNTANNNTVLGQNFSVHSLNFLGTGTDAAGSSYTIGGASTLTIGAGGINVDPTSATTQTISSNVALAADQTWTVNGSSSQFLVVSGSISGNFSLTDAGGRVLILSGTNSYLNTTINSGSTLQAGSGGTTGSLGTGSVLDNGSLILNRSDTALVIAGVISGSGTVTKASTGTVTLSGANSYAGLTSVTGGALTISNATALGTTAAGTVVSAGAAVQMSGGITVTGEALSITATASTATITAGLIGISGVNEWAGPVTLLANGANNVRVSVTGGTLTISGNMNGTAIPTAQSLVLVGTGTGIISGVISGSMGIIETASAGSWTLSGANTFTGPVAFQGTGGTMTVTTLNNFGEGASSLGAAASGKNTLNFGNNTGSVGGTLKYIGTGSTTDRVISLSGAAASTGTGTLDQSGSGTLKFTGNVSASQTGAKTFALTGSTAATAEISGIISDGSGTVALTKNGTGSWTLSGTNTYSAGTTLNAGTLLANNATSSTGSGAVVVNATGTLGGTGAITTSGLTVAGGGTLSPGDPSSNSGLGNLKINGSATLSATSSSTLSFQITHTSQINNSNLAANLNPDGSIDWNDIIAGGSGFTKDSTLRNDTLTVNGTLTFSLSNATTVQLSAADTGTFRAGMVWDLMDWTTIANSTPASYNYSLSALNSELSSQGLTLDTSRFADSGFVGVISNVPEPSRALLLLTGTLACALRRRRR